MLASTAATPPPGNRSLPAGQRGFSMIEALIAAAIIGFVAIGVIPLFARAMSDNMAGSDYTRVSNYSKSEEEDFYREPFANYSTAVASGQTSSQIVQYIDPVSKQWFTVASLAAVPQNSKIQWTRTITYTQYDAKDMDDDQLFDNPLPGGTAATSVQVIQAMVQVQAIAQTGIGGGHRSTTIRFLKAF
jgi:prepilin-type N-terminal cleavage/methylation domain-containing protein